MPCPPGSRRVPRRGRPAALVPPSDQISFRRDFQGLSHISWAIAGARHDRCVSRRTRRGPLPAPTPPDVPLRRPAPGEWIFLAPLGESVCPYCGVGCRLRVEGATGTGSRASAGSKSAPANLGRLCAKGALLGPTVHTPDRATHPARPPLPRRAARPGHVGRGPRPRRRPIPPRSSPSTGPDAVAFYGSGQLDTEAAYLAVKLFKGFLGTNNTDSNSRLCMAAAAAGYRSARSARTARRRCYDDIDHADVVLVIGSNMAEAHPVTFDRLRTSKRNRPDQQVIVVDPRRTATCAIADLHLPDRPRLRHRLPERRRPADRPERPGGRALHRLPHQGVRRVRRLPHVAAARRAGRDVRRPAGPGRAGGPAHRQEQGVPVLLLHGGEPEHPRDVEEQQPHQPAPAHRADRQGRGRAVLADRPAERHGRPRVRAALPPTARVIGSSRTRSTGSRSSTPGAGRWGACPRGRA